MQWPTNYLHLQWDWRRSASHPRAGRARFVKRTAQDLAAAEPAAHRALHRAAAALAERASQPPAKRRKSSESD